MIPARFGTVTRTLQYFIANPTVDNLLFVHEAFRDWIVCPLSTELANVKGSYHCHNCPFYRAACSRWGYCPRDGSFASREDNLGKTLASCIEAVALLDGR